MARWPRSRRSAALAAGLPIIFSLASAACAARHAPLTPSASLPQSPGNPSPTIETTDGRLAAALAAHKANESAQTLRHAAEEYLRLKVFDQAISLLGRAIKIAPNDAELFDARARARRDWGQPELGLGDAHRAVYLAPQSAAAHNTLGTLQFALGLLADSSASFSRALRLAPDAAWALNNLCYGALMNGDVETALSRCMAALERDSGMSVARNNLATVHAVAGRLDQAREVLLSSGDRRSGLYNMGILLLAAQDYGAAAEAFSEACRDTPSFEAACKRAVEARTLAARRELPSS